MSGQALKIGMIGLDTSHVTAFSDLLNNKDNTYHVPGGKVVVAYPGGSADFELSCSRVENFTKELKEKYDVQIVDSPEAVAEQSDVVLLESVDGRVHLELFKRIVQYGKPLFIDKPMAVSYSDAEEIFRLANENNIPIMSCSSLRYAEGLQEVLADDQHGDIFGIDCYGPLALQETQPGLFWYGIHTVEMLFRALGTGCVEVRSVTNEDHDLIVGTWADGRIGTIRGNRKANHQFGAVVHRDKGSQFVDVHAHAKPYYASMLEKIMVLFQTGKADIEQAETLQIIRFIEAANESRKTGQAVKL